MVVIGERARHSQVCSIENRDIYIYLGTYVCHIFSLTFSAPTSETLSVLFNREYPTLCPGTERHERLLKLRTSTYA